MHPVRKFTDMHFEYISFAVYFYFYDYYIWYRFI